MSGYKFKRPKKENYDRDEHISNLSNKALQESIELHEKVMSQVTGTKTCKDFNNYYQKLRKERARRI